MKFLTLMLVLLVTMSGCKALMNAEGAAQPVKRIDAKEPIYFTTCSGAVEDWGTCNSKAQRTCDKGYETVKKAESNATGYRELTFRCK